MPDLPGGDGDDGDGPGYAPSGGGGESSGVAACDRICRRFAECDRDLDERRCRDECARGYLGAPELARRAFDARVERCLGPDCAAVAECLESGDTR